MLINFAEIVQGIYEYRIGMVYALMLDLRKRFVLFISVVDAAGTLMNVKKGLL